MILTLNGKSVDAREMILDQKYLRAGDFLVSQGDIYYVEAIQRGVPAIENLKPFTMITLIDRSGNLVSRRDITGLQKVWRVKK